MKKVKIKSRKKGTPVLPKVGYILVTVLKSNKSCIMKWVKLKSDAFSVDGHTYFVDPNGGYIGVKGILQSVYLEGASLPIHHGSLEYETLKAKDKTIKDHLSGKTSTVHLPERKRIKNVKYDSGLIDMLLNRKLADVFTRTHMDLPNLLLTVLLIVTVGVGFVNVGLHFL